MVPQRPLGQFYNPDALDNIQEEEDLADDRNFPGDSKLSRPSRTELGGLGQTEYM